MSPGLRLRFYILRVKFQLLDYSIINSSLIHTTRNRSLEKEPVSFVFLSAYLFLCVIIVTYIVIHRLRN